MQQDPPARTMVLLFSADGSKMQQCFTCCFWLHWALLGLMTVSIYRGNHTDFILICVIFPFNYPPLPPSGHPGYESQQQPRGAWYTGQQSIPRVQQAGGGCARSDGVYQPGGRSATRGKWRAFNNILLLFTVRRSNIMAENTPLVLLTIVISII